MLLVSEALSSALDWTTNTACNAWSGIVDEWHSLINWFDRHSEEINAGVSNFIQFGEIENTK